jgi:tRNA U38,U39,U40 pseudouridine synthase TruA
VLIAAVFQAIKDPDALGAAIRSHLPPDVTIFGAPRKVANSFNSKNAASSRRYEYILPTYVFSRTTIPDQSSAAAAAGDDGAALPPPAFADDDDDMGGSSPPRCARQPLISFNLAIRRR